MASTSFSVAKDNSATVTEPSTRRDSASESNFGCDGDNLSPPPPPSNLSQFEEGEKVLANHKGCFYEAKILEVSYEDNEWNYYVHYVGWNKSWDEWIRVDCVLKHTEENIEKHGIKEGVKSAMGWRVSKTKPRCPNVARGRKRKQDPVAPPVEEEEEEILVPTDKVLTLNFPPALRKQLNDDFEFVTKMHKLVELPRSPNVEEVLTKYRDSIMEKDGRVSEDVEEILKGLRLYFDMILPKKLLYNNERKQYEENVFGVVYPSTVYGAEHLLRLLVKMPDLLIPVEMAEHTMKELQDGFVDILRFLRKNQSSFFLSTYKSVE